jgi:dienelactone hydrolase
MADGCRNVRAVRRRGRAHLGVMGARAVVLAVLFAVGCTASRPVFPPDPAPGTLFRSLYLPQGAGPFPAVVLLHTCAGVQDHVVHWAHTLRAVGYAALVVDSFRPRGAQSVCNNWVVTVDEAAMDAFAALRHLRERPGIDGDRIAVIGFSYGASAALRVASTRYQRAAGIPGFRAAVAVYPTCVSPRPDWSAVTQERMTNLYSDVETPTLILIGDADVDSLNVVANCAARVAELRRAGRPVDIKLYPGAGHAFDQSWAYHAEAADDAVKTSLAFFGRHLGTTR